MFKFLHYELATLQCLSTKCFPKLMPPFFFQLVNSVLEVTTKTFGTLHIIIILQTYNGESPASIRGCHSLKMANICRHNRGQNRRLRAQKAKKPSEAFPDPRHLHVRATMRRRKKKPQDLPGQDQEAPRIPWGMTSLPMGLPRGIMKVETPV